MWVINPAVGCHYFPPGPQLPSQPLKGLPISLHGEQWMWTVYLRLLPDSVAMIFFAKSRQLWKTAGYCIVRKQEFQTSSVKGAVKSYCHLCLHTLPVVFDVDLSPCSASIQPCVNKKLMQLARVLCMLCCFNAFGTHTGSFCQFAGETQQFFSYAER